MEIQNRKMNFFEFLIEAIKRTGSYNKNDQTAPAVILWTDKERQWETLLPRLREVLPILTFDSADFNPIERKGPAYYLRCLLARSLPEENLQGEVTIIYLPGVSKQEMRAVEECPKALQPLVELQYRGVFFTQKNGKDWTIAAFLQSKDGGVGIDVVGDQATRDALKQTLLKLADVSVDELHSAAPIKEQYLFGLLNPDDVRSLINWLNDPDGFSSRLTREEWAAFCGVCRQKYQFSPEKDGPITAAEKLGTKYGVWHQVWERYSEMPQSFPNISDLLRSARPTQLALFERADTWPQDNEAEENVLRQELLDLQSITFQQACAKIVELEQNHGKRRRWVWAKLNEAPLAGALKYLYNGARSIQSPISGNNLEEISHGYTAEGWQVDDAILGALASVEHSTDMNAVNAAIQAVYRPWLEATAQSFQKVISDGNELIYKTNPLPLPDKGTCVLFSDGLRMDLAHRLEDALESRGFNCEVDFQLAALPPITATAKPAVISTGNALSGKGSPSLDPFLVLGKSALTAEAFRKLLAENGFQILKDEDCGDPSGRAWTELGEIDAYGHQHSSKLATHIQGELLSLERRIVNLLNFGWKQIIVVTDHGWLLLPGGLPKVQLPEHLTILRKGRCARLKEGAQTEMQTMPWYWDKETWIAFAPGIGCFEAGKDYEHGGLSPQECVTPVITIQKVVGDATIQVQIQSINWKGMRCSIRVEGAAPGISVDLRSKAGDPTSSVANSPREPDTDGYVSLVVEDDDRQGEAIFVVVLASNGLPCAQMHTTIGG